MSCNQNRPRPGTSITIDPIRSTEGIKTIQGLLHDNPRNNLLFVMGINTVWQMRAILRLRVRDIRCAELGGLVSTSTGVYLVNEAIYSAIRHYMTHYSNLHDTAYVFTSRKGKNTTLTLSTVNSLVKRWAADAGLAGNYGVQTLRKTWGYHQHVHYGTDIEIIRRIYKHTHIATTMRYIGVCTTGKTNENMHSRLFLNGIGAP